MNLHFNLENYDSKFQQEIEYKKRMLNFLDNCKNPFSRTNIEGHFTASALLLNSDKTKFLLMHHKKLGKWLQLGGHCDGDSNVLAVAIKEAQEESGILNIQPISREIFDIDIHLFPSNSKEKEHYHYDIRFLLKTVNNDYYIKNSESNDLKWIEFSSYNPDKMLLDNSVKRLVEKFLSLYIN
jgi:8-oxo-dGTP pyrophosphatase MutT (NUDIX family)